MSGSAKLFVMVVGAGALSGLLAANAETLPTTAKPLPAAE